MRTLPHLEVNAARRRWLQALLATPLCTLPLSGQAAASRWLWLLHLHPTRLIGGLVLNAVKTLVVKPTLKSGVRALLAGEPLSDPLRFAVAPLLKELDFWHPGYKASVVRLGLVDYESDRSRQIALALRDDPEARQRFLQLRDYLREEKLRVKLTDGERSVPVTADTSVDDLFTLDYLIDERDPERLPLHYEHLIQVTQVGVFDPWYS